MRYSMQKNCDSGQAVGGGERRINLDLISTLGPAVPTSHLFSTIITCLLSVYSLALLNLSLYSNKII